MGRGRRRLGILIGLGLVAAAVRRELKAPGEERTWRGRLGGVIPYDLRPPTLERARKAVWDPENSRLLTEMPFGVGWSVNLGRLVRVLGQARSRPG